MHNNNKKKNKTKLTTTFQISMRYKQTDKLLVKKITMIASKLCQQGTVTKQSLNNNNNRKMTH